MSTGGLNIRWLAGALLAGFALAPAHALAQEWPARAIRLLVPSVPGGVNDLVSRLIGERLSGVLGQTILIDNRPGAGGSVAFDILSKSNPDGYTLGMTADSLTIFPVAYRNLGFDPRKDLAPITLVATQPFVLAVSASVPAASAQALFAMARAKPGTLSYGTPGTGTSAHFTGELLKRMAKIDIVHVPYKGGGAAIADLVGGQIEIGLLGASTVMPQVKAGKVRILAASTGVRARTLPDVPTLAESGVAGFDMAQWVALLGPARLPAPIVARLNAEIGRLLVQPAVRERLEASGFEPAGSTPEQLALRIRDGIERWRRLAQELKLQLD
jgi:tripartite-type tricarboxylate transporter receptor subunit TctC